MKQLFWIAIFSCVISFESQSQGFYDIDVVQEIEITFAQSNWDQLLDNEKAGSDGYVMATSVEINGVLFDSVGVKYKGNSTYRNTRTKNPFHIELNTYKNHDYEGYTDIKLSNVYNDPSFVREVLSYEIIRNYMAAPLSNYANVSVNGTLIGLYVSSEAINKSFVNEKFGSKSNTFVKCNPPAGAGPGSTDFPDLVYLGNDSTDYYDSYEIKSDHGWKALIDLCDTLKNNTANVESILDVDRALWMLALNNVLVNLDSYIGGFKQNYYMYRDEYGIFNSMIWDLNESFGVFSMTGSGNLNSTTQKQQMSHLLHENDPDFPLMQELMDVPTYKRMYLAHIKTILLEQFDNDSYYSRAQALQSIIDGDVSTDQNKFYTYANFLSNLTTDITGGMGSKPGIRNLMGARSTYLLGLSDFTQVEPSITNVLVSDTSPTLNSTVAITADVTNEVEVWLGFRNDFFAPFTRVQMFDDGAHNDGGAGDGTYGVDLLVDATSVQYYIYAENAGIGKFDPVRAEFEFYEVHSAMAADVVINEFMPSNRSTAMDQDSEYDDWVELYNNTSLSVDLSGYGLSDNASNLLKWTFPSGTSIGANDYLIVWADKDSLQSGMHANFKLSAGGERVFLSNTLGVVLDQISFNSIGSDISYGRYPNGVGTYREMPATFAAMNSLSNSVDTKLKSQGKLKAYPNPASASFNLELINQDGSDDPVLVYDLLGSVVYQGLIQNRLTISTANWAPGLYFVQTEGQGLKLSVVR